MKRPLPIALILVLVWLSAAVFSPATSFGQTDLLAEQGVVRVTSWRQAESPSPFEMAEATKTEGSGVIVHTEGDQVFIVTNHHVVRGADSIRVATKAGLSVLAENTQRDPEMDLALLVTRAGEDLCTGIRPLVLAGRHDIQRAATITSYGYSSGSILDHYNGQINTPLGQHLLFTFDTGTDMPKGLSGGALLSEHGIVLGINVDTKSGYNRAIRADWVCETVESWGVRLVPSPTPSGKTGIWVARMDGDEDCGVQKWFIDRILREFADHPLLREEVEVRDLERCIVISTNELAAHREASVLGSAVNGALVVWGRIVDSPSGGQALTTRLSLVRRAEEEGSRIRLLDIPFAADTVAVGRVGSDAIAQFIAGYSLSTLREYDAALDRFDTILRNCRGAQQELEAPRTFLGDMAFVSGTIHWRLGMECDRKRHLKAAINCYEEALAFYDPAERLRIAHLRNNRGISYCELPPSWWQRRPFKWFLAWLLGSESNRIKSSVDDLEAALKIYEDKERSLDWSNTQNNLALAYSKRQKHHAAITACEKGLERCPRIDRGTFDRAILDDLERHAIPDTLRRCLNLGSSVLICRADSSSWILADSGQYDVFYLIDDDGQHVTLAEQPHPLLYAPLTNNLGLAYYSLSEKGSPDTNINHAIEQYRNSLEIRVRSLFELDHAKVKSNLGLALEKRAAGVHKESLEEALLAYTDAYEIYRDRSDDPSFRSWAEFVHRRMRHVESRLAQLDGDGR